MILALKEAKIRQECRRLKRMTLQEEDSANEGKLGCLPQKKVDLGVAALVWAVHGNIVAAGLVAEF